jgi:hypothetical protein
MPANGPNQTLQIQQAEAFDLGGKFKLFSSRSKSFGCNYKEQKLEPSLPPNALYFLLGAGLCSFSVS